ncbi:hypothetical protein BH11MYX2_BH11MYX2_00410 [soil metagenome]
MTALLLAPLAGCSVMLGTLGRPEKIECKDYAFTSLVDLATAALIGGISYAEDGSTGGYVSSGVFVGSALVGLTGSIVCEARHERQTSTPVFSPRGSSLPPESLRLDPQTDGIRDATPEELGLVPTPTSPKLDVHPDSTPPYAEKELDKKVRESYQTGADGYGPPNRDGSSKPTVQPPLPPPPTCQLSPRIDCPQKTHCVLTAENQGVCEAIP